MKKWLSGVCLVFMLSLLAGCMGMELPFNIGASKESDEPVEVVASEDEKVDESVAVEVKEDAATEEEVESEVPVEAATTNQCDEENHTHLTDQLEPGFYIPECAVLDGVSKDSSGRVHGSLKVENGDWEGIYHDYKAFLENYLTSESLNIGSESAEIYANLYESENIHTIIHIKKREDFVHVDIFQDLPE